MALVSAYIIICGTLIQCYFVNYLFLEANRKVFFKSNTHLLNLQENRFLHCQCQEMLDVYECLTFSQRRQKVSN